MLIKFEFISRPDEYFTWLRRLDHITPWPAVGMGIISGGMLAVLLLIAHPIISLVGFVSILGLATLLAYSGEPVADSKALQANDG